MVSCSDESTCILKFCECKGKKYLVSSFSLNAWDHSNCTEQLNVYSNLRISTFIINLNVSDYCEETTSLILPKIEQDSRETKGTGTCTRYTLPSTLISRHPISATSPSLYTFLPPSPSTPHASPIPPPSLLPEQKYNPHLVSYLTDVQPQS